MKKTLQPSLILLLFAFFQTGYVHASGITADDLKQSAIKPLTSEEIKQLVVSKIAVVRNIDTLDIFAARFTPDGKRVLQRVTALKEGPRLIYQRLGDADNKSIAAYEVRDNRLITKFDNQHF